jgi:hypothetical protein
MIPGFGLIRRLLITVLLLGALFVGANVYLTGQAETRIADAVEKNFAVPGIEVDIDDFPLVLHLFTGKIKKVTLSARDTTIKGLEFRDLEVALEGLDIEGGLIGKGKLAISVERGTMSATAGQEGINAFLRERNERATVTLRDGGRVTVRATRTVGGVPRKVVAQGRFVLDKKKQILRFVPSSVTIDGSRPPEPLAAEAKRKATIEVSVPRLPGDIKAEQVEVKEGALVVRAKFTDEQIKIAG